MSYAVSQIVKARWGRDDIIGFCVSTLALSVVTCIPGVISHFLGYLLTYTLMLGSLALLTFILSLLTYALAVHGAKKGWEGYHELYYRLLDY